MSNRIHVATRKGFFTIERTSGGWKVAKVDFLGQNATMCLADPRDQTWYVALDHGHFGVKLHRSTDYGTSWTECGVPTFPAFTDEDRKKQADAGEFGARRDFSSLKEIWELVPAGADRPGELWAGTIPGGLFYSRDRGDSWEMIRSLWDREDRWRWFGGGKDSPGIHSVTVDPADSRNVAMALSCGGAWFTEDRGETWEARCHGMRAAYMPPEQAFEPNAQDPHRMAQCTSDPNTLWVQHHNGIFRTANRGKEWKELVNASPSGFGFAVAAHPKDPMTAWFVPGVKDECRLPVEGKFVVTRTRDGGETFESLTRGLPNENAYDIVYRHAMDVNGDGKRLAVGSTTGSLWVSENEGDAWTPVSEHLPPIHCVRFDAASA